MTWADYANNVAVPCCRPTTTAAFAQALRRYSYLTRVRSLDLTQVCQPISSLLDSFRTALAVKSSLRSRPGARS